MGEGDLGFYPMKNLIQGILEFRATQLAEQKAIFSKLALGQKPDALFIACSDSRVVPNVFASTKPGDLLVQRCVGNMVPQCNENQCGHSEGAAIEFSILNLNIRDIIVCGHSECGAMISLIQKHRIGNGLNKLDERSYYRNSITSTTQKESTPFLNSWLNNGTKSVETLKTMSAEERMKKYPFNPELSIHNQLAQVNVQLQIENLLTYPVVKEAIESNKLRVHGWYFDIASCSVYTLLPQDKCWALIDENVAPSIMEKLNSLNNISETSVGK